MSILWKKDTTNHFTIAARKRLSGIDDFEVFLHNITDDITTKIVDLDITEIIKPTPNPLSFEISEVISQTDIRLVDPTGLYEGSKLKVNDTFYITVDYLDGDLIHLFENHPTNSFAVGNVMTESGNTGDYKVTVTPDILEEFKKYQFIISSKKFNVQCTSDIIELGDLSENTDIVKKILFYIYRGLNK